MRWRLSRADKIGKGRARCKECLWPYILSCAKMVAAAGYTAMRRLGGIIMEVAYLLPGEERCIPLPPKDGKKQVAYSYRTERGDLFECICRNKDEAEQLCEDWIMRRERY